jgi:predicted transport protein
VPLFAINAKKMLEAVEQSNFNLERDLQKLIEVSLGPVFRCRFVASEFPTGIQHGGRIDTLALSEDSNPVIIEYKKGASSELITQSLYYLAWIHDHRGDFAVAVRKALGSKIEVDWDDVRVICLAPSYKKFDLHAVQVMGASIELWTYRLFANQTLYLEEIQQKELVSSNEEHAVSQKNPVMVAAGKKAALSRKTGVYTVEQHLKNRPAPVKDILLAVQEFVMSLDAAIEERPKKLYIAYRTTQNIVCVEPQQKKVCLFLKLDPKKITLEQGFARDVSKLGHFGTGDVEVTLTTLEDLERAKPLIQQAYAAVGG